jgi:MFS family permease
VSLTEAASARGRPGGERKAAALALLAFAMLIVSLDQYIVVVALPEIGRELDYSAQTLQSVISAYAVASAGFLLLGGRAADLLGPRRVFVSGLALYAGASLAGGLAPAPEILLAARAVQGLGGALVFPATLALVNTMFAEGRERNRALAVWGGAGADGLVIGVLLGGVLTEAFGWEAVFFVNVPLTAIAVLLAFELIAADRRRDTGRRFDVPGALAATLDVTLLVFALVQGPTLGWGSPAILAGGSASLLLLAAFAAIERRSRDPLLPPRLLANRNLATAAGSRCCSGRPSARCRGRRLGARRSAGDALWPEIHPGRRARHRRARRAGPRPGDVPERLLRHADPRPRAAQHRRRRRVHHDVHRRGDGGRRRRAGRRIGHRLHQHLDRSRRRPRPARAGRQLRHRWARRRGAADRHRGRPQRRRAGRRGRDRGHCARRPELRPDPRTPAEPPCPRRLGASVRLRPDHG